MSISTRFGIRASTTWMIACFASIVIARGARQGNIRRGVDCVRLLAVQQAFALSHRFNGLEDLAAINTQVVRRCCFNERLGALLRELNALVIAHSILISKHGRHGSVIPRGVGMRKLLNKRVTMMKTVTFCEGVHAMIYTRGKCQQSSNKKDEHIKNKNTPPTPKKGTWG